MKNNPIFVHVGRLDVRDRNFGALVACYVCDAPHQARGLARIEHANRIADVPLCEACAVSDRSGNVVIRKFLGAPDLKIIESGKATTEQAVALAEKQGTTQH